MHDYVKFDTASRTTPILIVLEDSEKYDDHVFLTSTPIRGTGDVYQSAAAALDQDTETTAYRIHFI